MMKLVGKKKCYASGTKKVADKDKFVGQKISRDKVTQDGEEKNRVITAKKYQSGNDTTTTSTITKRFEAGRMNSDKSVSKESPSNSKSYPTNENSKKIEARKKAQSTGKTDYDFKGKKEYSGTEKSDTSYTKTIIPKFTTKTDTSYSAVKENPLQDRMKKPGSTSRTVSFLKSKANVPGYNKKRTKVQAMEKGTKKMNLKLK